MKTLIHKKMYNLSSFKHLKNLPIQLINNKQGRVC